MVKKSKLLYVLWFVLALFMFVIVAGIYKFNFTDDDIYMEINGTLVPYNEVKN